jgi:hypothetical protein
MKKNLKIINKNLSTLLMLLLFALGLANIAYNVIKNWKIKENSYSVKLLVTHDNEFCK